MTRTQDFTYASVNHCYTSVALADRTRLKYLSSITAVLKLITLPSYLLLMYCASRPCVKSRDAVGTTWVVRGKTGLCQPLNANPKRRISIRGPMNPIPIDCYPDPTGGDAGTSIPCANPYRAQNAVLMLIKEMRTERTARFWPGTIRSRRSAFPKPVTLVVDDPNSQLLLLWGGPRVRLPRLGLADEHDSLASLSIRHCRTLIPGSDYARFPRGENIVFHQPICHFSLRSSAPRPRHF